MAAGAVVLGCGVTAAVLLAGEDDRPAAAGAASLSTKVASIERRDLVETDTEDGTLGYSDERPALNRLSGTLTRLPAEGSVIRPGRRLFAVEGRSVWLLDGAVPAYRALGPSASDGADVRQLERNLRALGYDQGSAMTVDGAWDSGTTAAVRRFQSARGMVQDGTIELGRVVFLPGARRVKSVDVDLGSISAAGSGAADPKGSGTLATIGSVAGALLSSLQQTVPTTPAPTTPAATTTTPTVTQTETVTVTTPAPATTPRAQTTPAATPPTQDATPRAGGGSGGSGSAGTGSGGGSGDGSGARSATKILTTTSTHQIVTVDLDATKQSVARTGARVRATLPSGDQIAGRVVFVGKVAEAEQDEQGQDSGNATLKVKVRLSKPVKALDQAPVTIDFEQSRAKDVLAVPVTTLLAQPGGTFAVEVRRGSSRRLVRVSTGLFAAGFVEIEGDGLQPGMRVTNAGV